jgi:hypothetical protein
MDREFHVERVALHLVDRKEAEPRLAPSEIDLTVFEPDEAHVIHDFFSGHLDKVWEAQEGRRTFAAKFRSDAMAQHYQAISGDASSFFERSCQIAQRLHTVSKKVPASPGLLMVLWLLVPGDEQPYLGLFKMDPGEAERITLPLDEAGNLLLNLAVERIKRVLPDPRDRVLKWAVIPHPTRAGFDVKAKDEQGGVDPAWYFMDFLDCHAVPSEKRQTKGLLQALTAYAQERHAGEDWEPAVQGLLDQLAARPVITPEVVTETIEKSKTFEGFQPEPFLTVLGDKKAGELRVTADQLQAIQIEYALDNDISIKGPRSVVENLVQVVPLDGGYEFRIRTPGFQKRYV